MKIFAVVAVPLAEGDIWQEWFPDYRVALRAAEELAKAVRHRAVLVYRVVLRPDPKQLCELVNASRGQFWCHLEAERLWGAEAMTRDHYAPPRDDGLDMLA